MASQTTSVSSASFDIVARKKEIANAMASGKLNLALQLIDALADALDCKRIELQEGIITSFIETEEFASLSDLSSHPEMQALPEEEQKKGQALSMEYIARIRKVQTVLQQHLALGLNLDPRSYDF